ncbi:hypothetical protein EDD11_008897 [Mortierella claussenii]|nr:hypothetical protein EDD11_008897 [Mortierella claussenii]
MVTATSADTTSVKIKSPSPKAGFRNQSLLIRSQPIVLDFDAFPAPTSPLPIPKVPSSPSCKPSRTPSRTPPPKAPHDKSSSLLTVMPGSLRPPPRPRSIVSHLALSKPPSERLPPVPVILHSHDHLYSSTPTSPTTPTTPSFYSSFSHRYDSSPSNTPRSSSVGRVHGSFKNRTPRKGSNADAHEYPVPALKDTQQQQQRGRLASVSSMSSVGSQRSRHDPMSDMEEPSLREMGAPRPETNEDEHNAVMLAHSELPPRPVGLVATRYYGIESSMRWREGVDPIQKRFASSSGSWRCQDRFAVFFRPGDQIGPDQVVTKTFWSEAWPYPIETILYGTTSLSLTDEMEKREPQEQQEHRAKSEMSTRSDQESDGQLLASRLKNGLRLTSSETQLKSAASFPLSSRSRDPRYITSEGVQKIAKVIIPMPDVAIDQVELVKAPIKVELRIFILEAPLRIHASAFLLGRTVAGTTELYV